VVFIYLGVQSVEKDWKAMIAKLDIKGEHYLLNNNEYSALAEKFQISGIPRYILVDKNGRVFSDNAKRPGDDKLKPEIDTLLTAK
jgi:thioredoxin-related protein